MELEELKSTWQILDTSPPVTDLPRLLRKATAVTGQPVRMMKRNVWRQSITLIIVYGAAFTQIQPVFRVPVGLLYGITLIVFLGYYRKKDRLLKSMASVSRDENMATCLQNQLIRLKAFLRFYAVSRYFIIPIVIPFLLVCLWYYKRSYFYFFLGHSFHPGQEIPVLIGWLGVTILLTVPSIFISNWFMHRRYGQYIEQLERVLEELRGMI